MLGKIFLIVSLWLFGLSFLIWLIWPEFPGLWGGSLVLGLAGLVAGYRTLAGKMSDPQGRRTIGKILRLIVALTILLAAGSLVRAPLFNFGPPEAVLNQESLNLLNRLTKPVRLTAHLGLQHQDITNHLLSLYQKASPLLDISISQATTEVTDNELRLARPDSITIESENYQETLSPISQRAINAGLRRLISPNRLVYNLVGDGEKSVADFSPSGMSIWAEDLQGRKIYIDDYFWPEGQNLPLEARALIISGPRQPLSDEKQAALIQFLATGGRLLILLDPLTVAIDPETLAWLGLTFPDGLIIDPETAWAGTDEFFVVSQDFPAHPLTLGLSQPVVWPLTGAIFAPEGLREPASPDDPLASHTWALALSSPSSWLETDRQSLADKSPRYQADLDKPGPLVLATASSLANGGRLVLAADSDLAANAFINQAGNLLFMNNTLYWLLGAEDDLEPGPTGHGLNLTHTKARILFWIPTVVWPALAMFLWLFYHFRWRRQD